MRTCWRKSVIGPHGSRSMESERSLICHFYYSTGIVSYPRLVGYSIMVSGTLNPSVIQHFQYCSTRYLIPALCGILSIVAPGIGFAPCELLYCSTRNLRVGEASKFCICITLLLFRKSQAYFSTFQRTYPKALPASIIGASGLCIFAKNHRRRMLVNFARNFFRVFGCAFCVFPKKSIF